LPAVPRVKVPTLRIEEVGPLEVIEVSKPAMKIEEIVVKNTADVITAPVDVIEARIGVVDEPASVRLRVVELVSTFFPSSLMLQQNKLACLYQVHFQPSLSFHMKPQTA
jgi:hypothetical protein